MFEDTQRKKRVLQTLHWEVLCRRGGSPVGGGSSAGASAVGVCGVGVGWTTSFQTWVVDSPVVGRCENDDSSVLKMNRDGDWPIVR